MPTYRTVQGIRDRMVTLQQALRVAYLAESTGEMGSRATEAMAIIDGMLQSLRSAGELAAAGDNDQADRNLLGAAQRSLTLAWELGEKISLATSLVEMRARVHDFKTQADFADAYISAALGLEM